MSKKTCYFKCRHEGPLYGFPPRTYASYEKFRKWKDILREKDKEKDDYYISHKFKLCSNHFESRFIVPNKRLTRHAVPTLRHGITLQQEELLCSFIEANSKLVLGYNVNGEMVDDVIDKWKTIEPQLNELGPTKSYISWAEYLYDLMSILKTKEVIWTKDTCNEDIEVVKNSDDFTNLELTILLLSRKEITNQESPDRLEINFNDENGMVYKIEVGDSDDSKDSETSITWNTEGNVAQQENEIVHSTFTLNVASGGLKPLLQAADISPYEAPQDLNVKCKCNCSDAEVEDEFDAFGKEIAQQLRSMPTQTALETQHLLTSVLRSKQSKILNNSFLQ